MHDNAWFCSNCEKKLIIVFVCFGLECFMNCFMLNERPHIDATVLRNCLSNFPEKGNFFVTINKCELLIGLSFLDTLANSIIDDFHSNLQIL